MTDKLEYPEVLDRIKAYAIRDLQNDIPRNVIGLAVEQAYNVGFNNGVTEGEKSIPAPAEANDTQEDQAIGIGTIGHEEMHYTRGVMAVEKIAIELGKIAYDRHLAPDELANAISINMDEMPGMPRGVAVLQVLIDYEMLNKTEEAA